TGERQAPVLELPRDAGVPLPQSVRLAPAGFLHAGAMERDIVQSTCHALLELHALSARCRPGDDVLLRAALAGHHADPRRTVRPRAAELPARQPGGDTGSAGCRVRSPGPGADGSAPDADRECLGALAGEAVAVRAGRHDPYPAAAHRHARS